MRHIRKGEYRPDRRYRMGSGGPIRPDAPTGCGAPGGTLDVGKSAAVNVIKIAWHPHGAWAKELCPACLVAFGLAVAP